MNQTCPGVGTRRGHRILCLAERCRLGQGEESGGSQGRWPPGRGTSSQGRSPGVGVPGLIKVGAEVGRDLAWQMAGSRVPREPLPCPSCLATGCPGPSLPSHPFLAPQSTPAGGGGCCPAVIPIPQTRLLRLEIKCL